jgi:hypothetical protein
VSRAVGMVPVMGRRTELAVLGLVVVAAISCTSGAATSPTSPSAPTSSAPTSANAPTSLAPRSLAPTSLAAAPPTSLAPQPPSVSSPVAGPSAAGCTLHGADPDPACTPGTLNPAVTDASIGSTICVPGYTTRVRPPDAESEHLKVLAARAYGFTGPLSAVEGDHLVPLELGGNPESGDDISNFWDEPHQLTGPDGGPAGSFVKDGYENWLHGEVCRGSMTLADARGRIVRGWYESFVADGRP